MTILPRVSASKLKTYEKCPKMYLANYKSEQKGNLNIWAVIGTAAHKALEMHYRSQAMILPTFYQRVAMAVTADVDGFENGLSVQKNIASGLSEFNPAWYTPLLVADKLQLERYFRLPYPNATEPICTIEGYIDMVTTAEQVVDYKTGSEKPSKKYVENDLQFIIYYWAYQQLFGTYPSEVIYHRLRDNKQIKGKKFNMEKLDAIIKQFLADPMVYDMETPCNDCAPWCGVKRLKVLNAIS